MDGEASYNEFSMPEYGIETDYDLMRYLKVDPEENALASEEEYELSETGSVQSNISTRASPSPYSMANEYQHREYLPSDYVDMGNPLRFLPDTMAGRFQAHLDSCNSETSPHLAMPQAADIPRELSAHVANEIAEPIEPPSNSHYKPLEAGLEENFHRAQHLLQETPFGRVKEIDNASAITKSFSEEYEHIVNSGSGPHPYKYHLHLGELPDRSRVETQIKCNLFLTPYPEENLLHLPADTIARPRFQLRDDFRPHPQILDLEVDVVVPEKPLEPVLMCPKCISREKKRAFRKKTLDENEEHHWNENRARRIVIFNCRELLVLPLPKRVKLPSGEIVEGREIELPLRLACYCRHHIAKDGYKLVFTIRDYKGNIVARTVSDTIFITDNHKEPRVSGSSGVSRQSSVPVPNVPESPGGGMYSMDSGSEYSTSNSTTHSSSASAVSRTRRSSAYHPYSRSSRMTSHRSNSMSSGGGSPSVPPSPGPTGTAPLVQNNNAIMVASIQRAIPNQGSVRGGLEITLLGQGFHPGLVAMFGELPAVSTQCWSDSTIIAHLPPSSVAGPVPVSFQGQQPTPQSAVFTYVNDTGSKLVELALQVVGFKVNGNVDGVSDLQSQLSTYNPSDGNSGNNSAVDLNNQHGGGPVDNLAKTLLKDIQEGEQFILKCLKYIQIVSGKIVNLNMRNSEGQTMMHLASIMGYVDVVIALMAQGANVDLQDVSGMTPLHFAAMHGNRAITRHLLAAHADPFHRNFAGQTIVDSADCSVSDLLPKNQRTWYMQTNSRNSSSSTLASLLAREDLLPFFDEKNAHQLPTPESLLGLSVSDESADDDDDFLASVRRLRERQESQPPMSTRKRRTLMKDLQGMFIKALTRKTTRIEDFEIYRKLPEQMVLHVDSLSSSATEVLGHTESETDNWIPGASDVTTRLVDEYLDEQNRGTPFEPPRYSDIYPQANEKYRSLIIDYDQYEECLISDGEVESDIEQANAPTEAELIESWANNPMKTTSNDHMLFTFWIPIALIALATVVIRAWFPAGPLMLSNLSGRSSHLKSTLRFA
ncbi:Protein SPT23 [Wickerhamiella sorbophila]|uniref:Protein SPT23 n=1 Tax=Wickerhamiella sorbophila TaxID=45607 RepID=A0A2T0FDQ0_9ASCO|nr:Protein SPT23 [Wickerhamiella sorbophila]PRT53138.1 Protein SPT23 [Wickerhamiella sorbophila]